MTAQAAHRGHGAHEGRAPGGDHRTSWDEVHDTRATFLALLDAQCAPGVRGRTVPRPGLTGDAPLDTAAAVLLTLVDRGLVLAADGGPAARAVAGSVAELTGVVLGEVADADVVLVDGDPAPALRAARRGSAEAPEEGATVVVLDRGTIATEVELSGPGVPGTRRVALALAPPALDARAASVAQHPRGVDLVLAGPGHVVALPRSTTVALPRSTEVR